jgi:hypothetical protein
LAKEAHLELSAQLVQLVKLVFKDHLVQLDLRVLLARLDQPARWAQLERRET